VGAWEPDEDIVVGKRRARPKRRMAERRKLPLLVGAAVVLALIAGGIVAYQVFKPKAGGLAALPNPAVVAPGPFRTAIGDDKSITVGLEVTSLAKAPVTIVGARIVPPVGLKAVSLTTVPAGPENEGFKLTGDLPPPTAVTLGPNDRAVVAARYTVDCAVLLASADPLDERIFVTIQVGSEQREDELTAPVVGPDANPVPWLTATARRACSPGETPGSPEPTLPG